MSGIDPKQTFALRRELGEGFEEVQVPGRTAKPHPEPPHSVLTIGLVDREGEPTRAAVDRVIEFLGQRLRQSWTGSSNDQ